MEIVPGVYDFGGGYFKAGHTKAFFIEDGDGLILIDTLYDNDAHLVLEELQKMGKTAQDINHIVMTHGHRGHLGGLDVIKRMSDAPIYGHPWEADIISGDRNRQPVDVFVVDPIQSWPIIFIGELTARFNRHAGRPVDVLIEDGDQIGPLRAVHTPGHTPGHLAFYWPERRILFTGDAFVTWPQFTPGWRNAMLNVPQSWESLARLATMDVDVICPGHGDSILSAGGDVLRNLAASRPV